MWQTLNHDNLPADDAAYSDARRRVLGRLGEYVAAVVAPLNLRPTAAMLLREDAERVEVRVSTPSSHVVLVITPEGDQTAEIFFLRMLATHNLPAPRLLGHDSSRNTVPFAYMLQSYTGGSPLDWLADGPQMRVAARQVGRTLRRAHQIHAPSFGAPLPNGRWPDRSWPETLQSWLTLRGGLATRAEEVLGADCAAALWAATLEHSALAWDAPRVLHGAVDPARAIVTVGEAVQLEGLSRPGDLVAGDPLFDLAWGTLPRHPEAFRAGLLEGYTATAALAPEQKARLQRLQLLVRVVDVLTRNDAESLSALPEIVAQELGTL